MKIDISRIAETDGASVEIDSTGSIEGLRETDGDVCFDGPASFKGSLTNNGGVFKLEGRLHLSYGTQCAKCLKPLRGEVDVSVREDFVRGRADEDSEAYSFEGEWIELDPALRDNVLLSLPMRQLCSTECKGLCPVCGRDLNEGGCECGSVAINPLFEGLRDFYDKESGH